MAPVTDEKPGMLDSEKPGGNAALMFGACSAKKPEEHAGVSDLPANCLAIVLKIRGASMLSKFLAGPEAMPANLPSKLSIAGSALEPSRIFSRLPPFSITWSALPPDRMSPIPPDGPVSTCFSALITLSAPLPLETRWARMESRPGTAAVTAVLVLSSLSPRTELSLPRISPPSSLLITSTMFIQSTPEGFNSDGD